MVYFGYSLLQCEARLTEFAGKAPLQLALVLFENHPY